MLAGRHYTIISGTGRAGTTLLVRILTVAGVDTGFDSANFDVDEVARAGLEKDLRERPDCYVVKSPYVATYLGGLLKEGTVAIDHAIVCMRDLRDAAESRRRVQATRQTRAAVAGGLWGTSMPSHQEDVLAILFFGLLMDLTRYQIPTTFMEFPRFAVDLDYFVRKMSPVFPDVEPARLADAHRVETRAELITDFARG